MRHVISSIALSACLILPPVSVVFGANPGTQGQPSQSCQTVIASGGTSPGKAASAKGSAFNTTNGVAGAVYAGSPGTPSLANGSPKAVSQYDVACFQQP